jgi:hypothetical protein
MIRWLGNILIFAAPLGAQQVVVYVGGKPAPDSVTIFAYDTLSNVEAVAIDTRGRQAPSAKPVLEFHMWSIAKLVNASARKGNVVGLSKGTAFAIASWARSDGRVVTDTLYVNVTRPRVVNVEVCSSFEPVETDVGFKRRCVGPTTRPVGSSACVYVAMADRRGGYVTGLDPQLKLSNPHVWAFGSTPSLVCPDTTIDPYKLTYPLPIPR